jgi:hypothetical protein
MLRLDARSERKRHTPAVAPVSPPITAESVIREAPESTPRHGDDAFVGTVPIPRPLPASSRVNRGNSEANPEDKSPSWTLEHT